MQIRGRNAFRIRHLYELPAPFGQGLDDTIPGPLLHSLFPVISMDNEVGPVEAEVGHIVQGFLRN